LESRRVGSYPNLEDIFDQGDYVPPRSQEPVISPSDELENFIQGFFVDTRDQPEQDGNQFDLGDLAPAIVGTALAAPTLIAGGISLVSSGGSLAASGLGLAESGLGLIDTSLDLVGNLAGGGDIMTFVDDIFRAVGSTLDTVTLDTFDFDQSGGNLIGRGVGETLNLQGGGTPGVVATQQLVGGSGGAAGIGGNQFNARTPNGKVENYTVIKTKTLNKLARQARVGKSRARRPRGYTSSDQMMEKLLLALVSKD